MNPLATRRHARRSRQPPFTGLASIPGLRLRYDAQLEAERRGLTTAQTAALDVWQDETANNFDASQATAAARPILQHDGTRWLVRFDGVDDELESSHAALDPPMSVIVLARNRSDTIHNSIIDASGLLLTQGADTATQLRASDGFTGPLVGPDPGLNFFVVSVAGDTSDTRLRGAGSEVAGSMSAWALASFFTGGYLFITDSFSFLDLCAVLIFDGALEPADIQNIEAWLNTRFSI